MKFWGFAWSGMYQFTTGQWYHLSQLEKQDKVKNAWRSAEQTTETRDIAEWQARPPSPIWPLAEDYCGGTESRDFGDYVGLE